MLCSVVQFLTLKNSTGKSFAILYETTDLDMAEEKFKTQLQKFLQIYLRPGKVPFATVPNIRLAR